MSTNEISNLISVKAPNLTITDVLDKLAILSKSGFIDYDQYSVQVTIYTKKVLDLVSGLNSK